ncbi:MAG: type II secretion system protein GspM [Propionivibrio sp.]
MKSSLLRLAARFDALQVRERWLVAIAILGGIVLIGHTLFIAPAQARARLAERSFGEQQAQFAALNAQMQAMQSPNQDPNVAARAELASLKNQLAKQAERIATLENALVPPEQMTGLLEAMIGGQGGLRLLSLKTLPVAAALEKPAHGDATPGQAAEAKTPVQIPDGLFKHGVEIRLEGSYQELHGVPRTPGTGQAQTVVEQRLPVRGNPSPPGVDADRSFPESGTRMAHRLVHFLFISMLPLAAATALAQADLADPTRPPAGLVAEEASSEAAGGPVLQSVLIPRKGRAVAVIGGEQVHLGEMYGESRLTRLTEREAVLEGPNGVERLMLTPGIEKTNIVMKKTNNTPVPRRVLSGGKP